MALNYKSRTNKKHSQLSLLESSECLWTNCLFSQPVLSIKWGLLYFPYSIILRLNWIILVKWFTSAVRTPYDSLNVYLEM